MNAKSGYKFAVTDRLRRVITLAWGSDAEEWLSRLPKIVEHYSETWDIELVGLPDSGAMSCCVFGILKDGSPVALKIPFDRESGQKEADVLSSWAVHSSAPVVYKRDLANGVFMMERVKPGKAAEPTNSEQETEMISFLMNGLHTATVKTDTQLESVRSTVEMRMDWADERFDITSNSQGAELAGIARKLMSSISVSHDEVTVLHGDLQPKNILRAGNGKLKAIDPMPCLGPIEADAAFWACNQACEVSIAKRLKELARFGSYNLENLKRWATIFAIVELRPYSKVYSSRMADYLLSSDTSEEFKTLSAGKQRVLLSGAMANTKSI